MQLSGKTIPELEALARQSPELRAAILEELDVRKARRTAKGQSEKPAALRLRQELNGLISLGKKSTSRLFQDVHDDVASSSIAPKKTQQSTSHRPRDSKPRLSNRNPGTRSLLQLLQAAGEKGANNRSISPTPEQDQSIQLFSTEKHLKINAFAGSGKTTTLSQIAKSTKRWGIYFAFNRAIVNESEGKFPSNVKCTTVHSHAKRSIRSLHTTYANSKLVSKLTPNMVTDYLGIHDTTIGTHVVPNTIIAGTVLRTIRSFCHSCSDRISHDDVPFNGSIPHKPTNDSDRGEFRALCWELATQIWEEMKNPGSSLPLGHDGYFKLWALSRPKISADFILLDEAQDTNDVLLDVLKHQECQIVYVGDRYQQIYEWRGAVNALDQIETPHACKLTKSFRFGPQIALLANKVLAKLGETTQIEGNEVVLSKISQIEAPDAIVARTNATALTAVVGKLVQGKKVYVEGGVADLQRLVKGVYQLRDNGRSDCPEFYGFRTWEEVVEFSEGPFGEELATFVSIVKSFGLGNLWAMLKQVEPTAGTADITVATAHKAKGREWKSVQLCDDFVPSEAVENGTSKKLPDEDLRIIYVAITRAKEFLEIGPSLMAYLNSSRKEVTEPPLASGNKDCHE
jgi:hypothetical protein